MSTKISKTEPIWRFISINHKAIMWIGVCVGLVFTPKYGFIAPIVTYYLGVIVGYVLWS